MEQGTIKNRRKDKRIPPRQETLVYNGEVFGQLLDISKGGLAFAYTTDQTNIRDLFLELDLMCCNGKLHIPRLLCRSVSDVPLRSQEMANGKLRRRCVQFDSLTDDQRHMLKHFMGIDM